MHSSSESGGSNGASESGAVPGGVQFAALADDAPTRPIPILRVGRRRVGKGMLSLLALAGAVLIVAPFVLASWGVFNLFGSTASGPIRSQIDSVPVAQASRATTSTSAAPSASVAAAPPAAPPAATTAPVAAAPPAAPPAATTAPVAAPPPATVGHASNNPPPPPLPAPNPGAATGSAPASPVSVTVIASQYSANRNCGTESTNDTGGGQDVGWISNTSWLRYDNVAFGSGVNAVAARIASGASGHSGDIQFRLDSATATPFATIPVNDTGGTQHWTTVSVAAAPVAGTHTLYLTFARPTSDYFVNLNWFTFTG